MASIPKNGSSQKRILFSTIAEFASFYCALLMVALILVSFLDETPLMQEDEAMITGFSSSYRQQVSDRPCNEIYVVGEGETLHTISDKCGDPFIVEQNPHIQDPDDVFPGLVIKITPLMSRKLLR